MHLPKVKNSRTKTWNLLTETLKLYPLCHVCHMCGFVTDTVIALQTEQLIRRLGGWGGGGARQVPAAEETEGTAAETGGKHILFSQFYAGQSV